MYNPDVSVVDLVFVCVNVRRRVLGLKQKGVEVLTQM